jgi:hypothetical protein
VNSGKIVAFFVVTSAAIRSTPSQYDAFSVRFACAAGSARRRLTSARSTAGSPSEPFCALPHSVSSGDVSRKKKLSALASSYGVSWIEVEAVAAFVPISFR